MASIDWGKAEVVWWVKDNFPKGATCLDVGACDGKWSKLLGDYLTMDAVEVFQENISLWKLADKYRKVIWTDIANFEYEHYDLIIFGDVLEHMTVGKAQRVLDYAKPRCKDMIIGIPYLWSQDAIYGNPYEVHIQNDLTPELFKARYGEWDEIIPHANDYGYYHKCKL